MSRDILPDRSRTARSEGADAPSAASLIDGMHGSDHPLSTLAVVAVAASGRFRARLDAAPPFAPTIILIGARADPSQSDGATHSSLNGPLLVFGTGTTDATGSLEIELEFRGGVPSGLHPHCQALSVIASVGADQGAVTSNTVAIPA